MQKIQNNYITDVETLKKIRGYLPKKCDLENIERVFSVFADKTRIRIISTLSISPFCVSELSEILAMNQTTLSHQLAYLRSCGVVADERRGKTVVYTLRNSATTALLSCVLDFLEEDNAKNEAIAVDF